MYTYLLCRKLNSDYSGFGYLKKMFSCIFFCKKVLIFLLCNRFVIDEKNKTLFGIYMRIKLLLFFVKKYSQK